MRVGVYVDGYNLYYGARHLCRRGTRGWRWLDVRGLVQSIIVTQGAWNDASIERVVYCTARVDAVTNASAHQDQDVYLKALVAAKSVDHIEYGNYVARAKNALLATEDPSSRKPFVATSRWPVMVKDGRGVDVPNAQFMVKYLHLEEKGSDVNIATHLLLDVLQGNIEAAVVVSNDSDLALPVREARSRVPIGLVNPRGQYTAGDLRGQKTDGVGNHWWWNMQANTYRANQLPDPVSHYTRPPDW